MLRSPAPLVAVVLASLVAHASGAECVGATDARFDGWCNVNCNSVPAHCPSDFCTCEGDAEPTNLACRARGTLASDNWCNMVCNFEPPYCPEMFCVCDGDDTTPSVAFDYALYWEAFSDSNTGDVVCCEENADEAVLWYTEADTVYKFYVNSSEVEECAVVYGDPNGIVIDQDGDAWVTARVSGKLLRITANCSDVYDVFGWPNDGVKVGGAVTFAANRLYVSGETGIYRLTLNAAKEVVSFENTGLTPYHVSAMTTYDDCIYFTSRDKNVMKYCPLQGGVVSTFVNADDYRLPDISGVAVTSCGVFITVTDLNQIFQCEGVDEDTATGCTRLCEIEGIDADTCFNVGNPWGVAIGCCCDIYMLSREAGTIVRYPGITRVDGEDQRGEVILEDLYHPKAVAFFAPAPPCVETLSCTPPPSATPSASPTAAVTPSQSPSQTATRSSTRTSSVSPSQTPSQTTSQTISQTASQSTSQTASQTASQTTSQTASQSSSQSASQSMSQSASQTQSQTSSQSSSQTSSQSMSESTSQSPSPTRAASPSQTPTESGSQSASQTASQSSSESASQSQTASSSQSQTASETASQTASETMSQTASETASQTTSQTSSQTASETMSQTMSQSASETASQTASETMSQTASSSSSESPSQSPSATPSTTSVPNAAYCLLSTNDEDQVVEPGDDVTITVQADAAIDVTSANCGGLSISLSSTLDRETWSGTVTYPGGLPEGTVITCSFTAVDDFNRPVAVPIDNPNCTLTVNIPVPPQSVCTLVFGPGVDVCLGVLENATLTISSDGGPGEDRITSLACGETGNEIAIPLNGDETTDATFTVINTANAEANFTCTYSINDQDSLTDSGSCTIPTCPPVGRFVGDVTRPTQSGFLTTSMATGVVSTQLLSCVQLEPGVVPDNNNCRTQPEQVSTVYDVPTVFLQLLLNGNDLTPVGVNGANIRLMPLVPINDPDMCVIYATPIFVNGAGGTEACDVTTLATGGCGSPAITPTCTSGAAQVNKETEIRPRLINAFTLDPTEASRITTSDFISILGLICPNNMVTEYAMSFVHYRKLGLTQTSDKPALGPRPTYIDDQGIERAPAICIDVNDHPNVRGRLMNRTKGSIVCIQDPNLVVSNPANILATFKPPVNENVYAGDITPIASTGDNKEVRACPFRAAAGGTREATWCAPPPGGRQCTQFFA